MTEKKAGDFSFGYIMGVFYWILAICALVVWSKQAANSGNADFLYYTANDGTPLSVPNPNMYNVPLCWGAAAACLICLFTGATILWRYRIAIPCSWVATVGFAFAVLATGIVPLHAGVVVLLAVFSLWLQKHPELLSGMTGTWWK